ncbi:MAG: B12-binding domain-containing radical SAM protein [Proteobacteria bacterium]|nr:B12-binding domain-containing radical SAM protein [Pseudomonadota bacterium]
MNILLINSPIRLNARPNNIPYGLAVIAAVLRDHGHSVTIYDINAHRHGNHEIIDHLKNLQWDVAGISGLITTYTFQKWLISELKRICPQAPVISGGGLATTSYELLFRNSPMDMAVIGEGEATMLALLHALEQGSSLETIDGIAFRQGNGICLTPQRANIDNLDSLSFPAWDLLPMDIYLKNPIWGDVASNSSGFRKDIVITRSMNIISSRGCPFSCNYCYHLFGKSSYRYRSAQNIIDEMDILVERYDVDFVGFVDDNMMASEKRLREFCVLLKKKPWKVLWGCHGRVTSAMPEILELMAEAGCVWIGYGIESGSESMLNAMNKKADVTAARTAVVNTRKAGIYPNTTFIFGYPGETIETIQETIDFKKSLDITCGSFFATPYPGTELYSACRSFIRDEAAYIESLGDATDYCINLTSFDEQTLFRLKHAQDNLIDLKN